MLPLLALFWTQARLTETFSLEDLGGEGGVKATILGKPASVAFDATWPTSRISTASSLWDATAILKFAGGVEVLVGGRARVTVPLLPANKADMPDDADVVLATDALRKTTLVFDPLRSTVEFLGGPKIGLEGATRYFAKLPAWSGASKVVRLPLTRDKDGTPLIAATIGGRAFRFAPRLSSQGSILAKSVPHPPSIAGDEDWDFVPRVLIPGLDPAWIAYDAQEDYGSGGGGMLALDAFGSRRVIVDLGDDAMYVEGLAARDRESFFLSRMLALPIQVRGATLMIAVPPGEDDGVDDFPQEEVEIVSIGKVRAEDWIADLRAATPAAAGRLTKRLLDLAKGYEVTVIDAEGNVDSFNVPGRDEPKRSAPPGSLRAAAPARAGWRSR